MGVRGAAEMDALLNAIVNSVTRPNSGSRSALPNLGQMATYSYLLPTTALSPESRVVDDCVKRALEPHCVINWCSTLKRVEPVCTKGDGNCLMHAVSLAMWGIHDSGYVLRQLVRETLLTNTDSIRKRWQYEMEKEHSAVPGGFSLSEQEWQYEWDTVIRLVSDGNGQQQMYNNVNSLEAIHVFILANVLRRPILVYGEAVVRDASGYSFSPNNIVGAYLPLLCPANDCSRSPILLAFHNGHFVPLLSVANSEPEAAGGRAVSSLHCAPMVLSTLEQLRVHFLLHDDEPRLSELLGCYFDLDEVPFTQVDGVLLVLCAKLNHRQIPVTLRISVPETPGQVTVASARYWPLPAAQSPFGFGGRSSSVGRAESSHDPCSAASSGFAFAPSGYSSEAAAASLSTGLTAGEDAAGSQRAAATDGLPAEAPVTTFSTTWNPAIGTAALPSAPPLTQDLIVPGDACSSPRLCASSRLNGNDREPEVSAAVGERPPDLAPPPPDDCRFTSISGIMCVTPGCAFFSSIHTYPHCHECAESHLRAKRDGRGTSAVKPTTAAKLEASAAAVAGVCHGARASTIAMSDNVGSSEGSNIGSSNSSSGGSGGGCRIREQRESPNQGLAEKGSTDMICSTADCQSYATTSTYPYCSDCNSRRPPDSLNRLPGASDLTASYPGASASYPGASGHASRLEQHPPPSPRSLTKFVAPTVDGSSSRSRSPYTVGTDSIANGGANVNCNSSNKENVAASPTSRCRNDSGSSAAHPDDRRDVDSRGSLSHRGLDQLPQTARSEPAVYAVLAPAAIPAVAVAHATAGLSENVVEQLPSMVSATAVTGRGIGSGGRCGVAQTAASIPGGKCVHPECTDRASSAFGGLCKECYDIICEAKKKKRSTSGALTVPYCTYPRCDSVGHPHLSNLCHKHFVGNR